MRSTVNLRIPTNQTGFYSILYPSPEQEARSKAHDWLIGSRHAAKLKKEYVLQGNKLVLAFPSKAEAAPVCPILYKDVRFDQIIDAVCRGADAAEVKSYYYDFCCDEDMLRYRQEVFAALADANAYTLLKRFCSLLEDAQNDLTYAARTSHPIQRDRYLIDAVHACGQAMHLLSGEGAAQFPMSSGLCALTEAAAQAANDTAFRALFEEVEAIRNEFYKLDVRIEINSGSASVREGRIGQDYTAQIRETLRADRTWHVTLSREASEIRLFHLLSLNHLEVQVLDRVVKRAPRLFERMHKAALRVKDPIPAFLSRFVKEIRFYTAFLSFMNMHGTLAFTLPEASADDAFDLRGGMDLALALTGVPVKPNDFDLLADERGVIVTGANQGGKTTFARTIGQIVIMTMLGLPVCCEEATLPLYRQAYSVFSEAEDSTIDNGKLKEEFVRLKPVLATAQRETFVLLNEMFSSTTAQDALRLTVEVLDSLICQRARVLCVTHIHGIRNLRPEIVGMATDAPGPDGERDYRITRSRPDGNAYARDIASHYDLTADGVRRRIQHDH